MSSWAAYFWKPLRQTFSPNKVRNSSKAGPALSLLYISSSELWPALQYRMPTLCFVQSCNQNYTSVHTHTHSQGTFYVLLILPKLQATHRSYRCYLPIYNTISLLGTTKWNMNSQTCHSKEAQVSFWALCFFTPKIELFATFLVCHWQRIAPRAQSAYFALVTMLHNCGWRLRLLSPERVSSFEDFSSPLLITVVTFWICHHFLS